VPGKELIITLTKTLHRTIITLHQAYVLQQLWGRPVALYVERVWLIIVCLHISTAVYSIRRCRLSVCQSSQAYAQQYRVKVQYEKTKHVRHKISVPTPPGKSWNLHVVQLNQHAFNV